MIESISKKYPVELIAILTIWLFQASGAIGISIGYLEWFTTKTPLNLGLMFFLLIVTYPLNTPKRWYFFFVFFVAGLVVEWVGVKYGFLFGQYAYGANLGAKMDGVPWLIGFNWSMLVLATGAITNAILRNKIVRALVGGALMVVLDFFMEVAAPVFDFWEFEGGIAPVKNYIMWFLIAFILHVIYQQSGIHGKTKFAAHLYISQLVFFIYFYILFRV